MNEFSSIYSQGMARVAACTLPVALANPMENARRTIDMAHVLDSQGVALAVFPELGLVGSSSDDLLLQDVLLEAALEAIENVRDASTELAPVLVVGAPLRRGNRLYNCAVVIHRGHVLGVAPKSYLANHRESDGTRRFASGAGIDAGSIELPGVNLVAADELEELLPDGSELDVFAYSMAPDTVAFGSNLIFGASDVASFRFCVQFAEDLTVPVASAAQAALAGATLVATLSATPATLGSAAQRERDVAAAASSQKVAYIYAAGTSGESTTDLTWDGQVLINELGRQLAAGERFTDEAQKAIADVDLEIIAQERLRTTTFDDNRAALGIEDARDTWDKTGSFREVPFRLNPATEDIGLLRPVERFPFVPADAATLNEDCAEAYNIQVSSLCQRLRSIGQPKIIIGVSGGLDSTQALLVAAQAMDRLGRPRTDILAYTMPGFATSDHTKNNAWRLGESLGVTFKEIDIRPSATQMLKDMDHPFGRGEEVYDVTFENVQAGLRTDFLFRLANANNGIVLGTGDLSELALGWCTFGVGDHMSHYNPNAGVPKTLMQHLIRWVIASGQFDDSVGQTLQSILDTEISPELVPAKPGEVIQSSQAKIGPYELQDFTVYYLLRYGLRPSKIAFLQWYAWRDASAGSWPLGIEGEDRHEYTLADLKHWMKVFYRRFFTSQFKRSTVPNGPKVSPGGSLSPRGDWRMPSDATAAAWLADIERVPDDDGRAR